MSKNTEVTVKKETNLAVATPIVSAASFFDDAIVSDQADIVIPRVLLMQGTSDLVGKRKANQGDIIDSTSSEMLAGPDKPLEIIPIKPLPKEWVIEKHNGKKFEFERTEPWNPAVADQWEFVENGVKMRRNAKLSFYVLLARDSKSNHLPYLLAFQRTGYKAGKNLASFFQEARFAFQSGDKNSIPMGQIFELGCHIEQGDTGSYYVFDCKRTRLANEAEKDKAIYWFSQLRTNTYKVDSESEI
jgi:hypothetical protein